MADLNKLLNNIDQLLDDSNLAKVDNTLDNQTMTEGVRTDSAPSHSAAPDARQCADELQALDRCVEQARQSGTQDTNKLYETCSDKMDTFWSCMKKS